MISDIEFYKQSCFHGNYSHSEGDDHHFAEYALLKNSKEKCKEYLNLWADFFIEKLPTIESVERNIYVIPDDAPFSRMSICLVIKSQELTKRMKKIKESYETQRRQKENASS